MGIVVCVFMFLGLLIAAPWAPSPLRAVRKSPRAVDVLACGLLLAGLWNALWYGLRHLSEFWGVAALISGSVMILVAVILLVGKGSEVWRRQSAAVRVYAALKPVAGLLVAALGLCFVVYAVALVRLNLGMSIPG
jgi:hypothetical protein